MPQEPVPPAAMEKFDEAGAKAFAEFYWEVATYAQSTGDTKLLAELQMPLCEACTGAREWIESVYSKDGRIVASEMSGESLAAQAVGIEGEGIAVGFSVDLRLRTEPGHVVNRDGKVTRRSKAVVTMVSMSVDFLDSAGWRVSYWETTE